MTKLSATIMDWSMIALSATCIGIGLWGRSSTLATIDIPSGFVMVGFFGFVLTNQWRTERRIRERDEAALQALERIRAWLRGEA